MLRLDIITFSTTSASSAVAVGVSACCVHETMAAIKSSEQIIFFILTLFNPFEILLACAYLEVQPGYAQVHFSVSHD